MKTFTKKTCSAVVALVMAVPMIASCGKKDNGDPTSSVSGRSQMSSSVSGEEIEEDFGWFDVDSLDFSDRYTDQRFTNLYVDVLGMKDDRIALEVSRSFYDDYSFQEVLESEEAGGGDDGSDYNAIDIYDLDGELIRSVPVEDIYAAAGEDEEGYHYLWRSEFDGDKMRFTVCTYDDDWNESYSNIEMDIATGNLTVTEEDRVDTNDEEGSYEGSYTFDGYTVEKTFYWGDASCYYIIDVTKPSGDTKRIDFSTEIPSMSIFDINACVYIGDGRAVAQCTPETDDYSAGYVYVMLDLEDGSCELYENTDWLAGIDLSTASYSEDGRTMVIGREGLMSINFDDGSLEMVVDFNNCNLNRFDALRYTFLGIRDGKYYFQGIGEEHETDNGYIYTENIVVFSEADSNPNAGKMILRAAAPKGLTYQEAEAVRRFNEMSDEAFIVFDFSYNGRDNQEFGLCAGFLPASATLDEDAAMSNQLSIDLMTGDGPDIIFGTIGFSQMDNDNYLTDLSSVIPSDEEYFTNVFDAARVGGKLYQIPLDCGFSGITANGEDVGYDQAGFTFDSYREFVDEVCNGNDPVGAGRFDFLALCYSSMSDCFIDDSGNATFDNDAFRQLADFTSDIPEEGMVMSCDVCQRATEGVGYITISTLDEYLRNFGGTAESTRLMGIPSVDGRGPIITVDDSVAISANAADPDICMEFVRYALSYEGQMIFANSDRTPVMVRAFEDGAQTTIDEYNAQVQRILQFSTREELAACGFFAEEVDEGVIDAYEGFIRAACTIEMTDPSVLNIIREEIGAYYEGQKTMEEIIPILENRVQTFVNERG
ncbi:MAG: extracellular solute-binding protein [Clostridiales bacterium]|nr:extracellular solute-binding protein [Clostridiales bacterium]